MTINNLQGFEAAWPEISKAGVDHGWRGVAEAAWHAALAGENCTDEYVVIQVATGVVCSGMVEGIKDLFPRKLTRMQAEALLEMLQERYPENTYSLNQLHRATAEQPATKNEAQALHPATADLVERFAMALTDKLAAAERKYGYSDGWLSPGWMNECRAKLIEHVAKGDPRDVAAYCAFLWHHGERTALPQALDELAKDAERAAELEAALKRVLQYITEPAKRGG